MFKKIVFLICLSMSASSYAMTFSVVGQPLSNVDPKLAQAIADLGTKALSNVAISLEATGVNLGATLQESVKILRKALENVATTFSENGFKLVLDPELDPKLIDSIQLISKDGAKIALNLDPALTKTMQTIAEKGFQIIVDPELNKNLKTFADQGVKAQFAIDPITLKTFCLTSVGATLAVAGILVLYHELTKTDATTTETESAQKTYFQHFKALLQNKYVIGSAQVLAGLLLIIKSNALIARG